MRAPLTVVRGARMFDGWHARSVTHPTVLIDGTRIAAVGVRLPAPEGVKILDLGGCTLLPGLIDTHVHLAFDAGHNPVATLAARDDDQVIASMLAAARAALVGGVTTLRDLGDRTYLSLDLRGRTDLPTVLTSGPPITTPGGHCHFLGGAVEPTARAVRVAVREHAERGVDVVKIMASGGNLTPGSRQDVAQFSPEVLTAAASEAHRLGLPITAHAHAVGAIRGAIRAGVDGIEHASFWSLNGVDARPEMIDAIAAAGIAVGATLGVRPVPGLAPPPEVLHRMPAIQTTLRELYRAGAVLVAGTDAGIAPIKPPDVVRYTPPALQNLGMSPVDALRTVTSQAAAALGIGDRKGRLAPGFDADILAVDGDPLTDPDALHRIRSVICRGSVVTARPAGVPAS